MTRAKLYLFRTIASGPSTMVTAMGSYPSPMSTPQEGRWAAIRPPTSWRTGRDSNPEPSDP